MSMTATADSGAAEGQKFLLIGLVGSEIPTRANFPFVWAAALRDAGCDLLTLGQYLMPSGTLADHYLPVVRYVPPDEFAALGRAAKSLGFKQVASGPFVRSSYHAREMAEMF